jgi:hypothetical protein
MIFSGGVVRRGPLRLLRQQLLMDLGRGQVEALLVVSADPVLGRGCWKELFAVVSVGIRFLLAFGAICVLWVDQKFRVQAARTQLSKREAM